MTILLAKSILIVATLPWCSRTRNAGAEVVLKKTGVVYRCDGDTGNWQVVR